MRSLFYPTDFYPGNHAARMGESWKQGSRSGRQHTSLCQQLQLAVRGADGAEKKTSNWARLSENHWTDRGRPRQSQYIAWQRRNFVPYLRQLIFVAILYVKLLEMFVTVIALKHALLVSQLSHGHSLKLTDSILFEQHENPRHLTQRIISCYTHKMAIVSWP